MATQLQAGQYFASFEEFMAIISQRKESLNEKLVVGKSSVSVKAANAKLKGDFRFQEDLVYTHVTLRCVHEGEFTSKGHKKQST
ncbi:hypothetical protein PoB_003180300, partial [Plakobranchus ocellatus]